MSVAFCFDLDGTVTTSELLPCIASELGVADEIATLTRHTMAGVIPFEDSLRLRSLILGQVPLARIHAILDQIQLDPALERFIVERPAACFIVTGNLDIWIQPLADRLGCEVHSSRATLLDGRVRLDHVLDKGQVVRQLRQQGRFDRIIAIGDGANDVPMLQQADIGIAFGGVHTPTPAATAAAHYVVHDGETLCSLLKAL